MKQELYTIQEVSSLLGVSPKTLRRWEETGKITPIRTFGNQRRYRSEDIKKLDHMINLRKTRQAAILERKAEDTPPIQNLAHTQFSQEAPMSTPVTSAPFVPAIPSTIEPETEQQNDFNKKSFVQNLRVPIAGFVCVIIVLLGFVTIWQSFGRPGMYPGVKGSKSSSKEEVLGDNTQVPNFDLSINIPGIFGKAVTFLDNVTIKKGLSVSGLSQLNGGVNTNNANINAGTGKVTASNIIYSILPGSNIAITGNKQNPTISATAAVSSIQGQTGAISFANGTGISLDGLTINNTGVTSVQGTTGDVILTGGSGISVSGTTISNTDAGSAQNIFKNITAGGTTISAATNSDTINFAAGSGITVTGDTGSNTITITSNSTGTLSGLTTNGVLYATDTTDATSTTPGATGTVLHGITNGAPVFSAVDLTSDVTNVLPYGNGGTGVGTTPINGQILIGNGSGYTLATLTQGTGIGITNGSGAITLSNSGVVSLTGTANQVNVSGATGAITVSLPQNINNAATPTFASLNLTATSNQLVLGTTDTATITTGTLTNNRTYTFPDGSGTVCLVELNNCSSGGGGGDIGGGGNQYYVPVFTGGAAIGNSDIYDNGKVGIGTISPQGLFSVSGGEPGQALVNLNNTNEQDILVGSESGATRFVFDANGDLNIVGGAYEIGGVSVLTSSTLGTNVINSSLISVGALSSGSIATGFGTILTANTIQGTDITATGTTGLTESGIGAGLTYSGGNNHIISASSGTLELGAFTLTNAVTGNNENLTGLNNLSAGGTITFGGLSNGIIHVASGALSSSAVNLADADVTGILPVANGGTGANLTIASANAQGSIPYFSNTGVMTTVGIGGLNTCLISNGSTPTWGSCASGASNPWQLLAGALSPEQSSDDLLLGSNATSSATFAFTGVASGTPTASISGVAGGVSLTATGILATTNGQTLQLGNGSTGNIDLFGFGAGVVQSNGSGVLSSSSLNLATGPVTGILPVANGGTGANLTIASANAQGSIPYFSNTGVMTTVDIGGLNTCLISNGSTPTWGSCASGTSNPWQLLTGALSPVQSSDDLLLGSSATSSAEFAFTGVANNTPVASISAVTGSAPNGLSLNGATSTIQSLNDKTLNIGGSSTGNIIVDSQSLLDLNTVNNKGIITGSGLTTLGGNLEVNGNIIEDSAGGTRLTLGATTTLTNTTTTLSGTTTLTASSLATFTTGGTLGISANTLNLGNGSSGVVLGTTSNQNLTLTPNGTGQLLLTSNYQQGVAIGAANTTAAPLVINGGIGNNGALIVNQLNNGDIIDASQGGTLKFSVQNNGNIAATGTLTGLTALSSAGNVTFTGIGTGNTSSVLFLNSSNQLALATTTSGAQQCLLSSGGATGSPTWGSCTGGGGATNFWQLLTGALSPVQSSDDLLLGSNATSSAEFAFTGVANNTPVASISAVTGSAPNGLSLNGATSTIQSLNDKTLNIGGSSTGNIIVDSQSLLDLNTVNNKGIITGSGLTTLGGNLEVNGNIIEDSAGGTRLTLGATTTLTNTTTTLSGTTTLTASSLATITTGGTLGISANTLNLGNGSSGVVLGTTSNQNLTLTPNGTGQLLLTSNYQQGVAIGAANTTAAPLVINGGIGNNGALIVNQLNNGDIIDASQGGALKFSVQNNGNIAATGTLTGLTALSSAGNVTFTGIGTGNTSSVLFLNSSNQLALATTTSGAQQCLLSSGGATGSPTWGSCTGGGGATNFWQLLTGALSPVQSSDDLLLGSNATSSAEFAFTGVANNTPVASISAVTGSAPNGLSLNGATSTIQSLNDKTLNIGGSSTGNIIVDSQSLLDLNTVNNKGIITGSGLTTLGGNLEVNGNIIEDSAGGTRLTLGATTTLTNTTTTLSGTTTLTASSLATFTTGGTLGISANTLNLGNGSSGVVLGTTSNQNLTLTPNGTGQLLLTSNYQQGVAIGAANTTAAPLVINGGIGNNGALIVNQLNNGDIIDASQGGTLKFSVQNNGNIAATGTLTGLTALSSAGNVTFTGIGTGNTSSVLFLNSSNQLALATTTSGAQQCLLSSGGATGSPTWGSCTGGGGATNFWQLLTGALSPVQSSDDLLLGSNATSSAEFAFTGVANNTPVASISAVTGSAPNGLSLNGATSTIQSLNDKTLNIGGSSTGNIIVDSQSLLDLNTVNNKGIITGSGLTTLGGNLEVNGNIIEDSAGGTRLTLGATTTLTNTTTTLSGTTTLTASSLATITTGGTLGISANTLNLGNGSSGVVLGTTSNQNLTLTPNGTGQLLLTSNYQQGVAIGAANTTAAPLVINGGIGNNGALIVNQLNNGDIIDASQGGALKFSVQNNGTITMANYNNCGMLTTTGTTLSCGTLPASSSYWQLNTSALSPGNSSYDLLLGGNATTSAKFAFIGNAGTATPVASISAQTASGIGLVMSPGQIQSLNNATLTIGGNTTGNILLEPLSGTAGQVQFFNANNFVTSGGALTLASAGNALNLTGGGANIDFTGAGVGQIITAANQNLALMPGGTGDVGVNVTSGLLATLDVRGNTATTPAASVSATSTYAAMEVNNNGSGDIFTASSSGLPRFTIAQNGNVFVGTTTSASAFGNVGQLSIANTNASERALVIQAASGQSVDLLDLYSSGGGFVSGFDAKGNLYMTGQESLGYSGSALAQLDVRNVSAVTPIASFSGKTTSAGLIVDNSGSGDIFTASNDGATKFTIQNNGNISMNNYNNCGMLTTVGTLLTCSAATAGANYFQLNGTAISQANTTEDLLLGGTSTASAKFAFIGNAGTATPVASISAQTASGIGLVMSPGQIQSLNNATLTIGGNTTGNILLEPLSGTAGQVQFFNANNFITSGGALTLASAGNALNLTGGGANIDFTGAGVGQIITVANQNLALMPGGTGDVGVNVTAGLLATLDVRGNTATTPAASVSATSSYAAMEVNNNGSGDLFTASVSGATKFTILNNGNIQMNNYTQNGGVLYTSGTGLVSDATAGSNGQVLQLVGNTPTWESAGTAGITQWQLNNNGTISQYNLTNDLLLGGTATNSADFAFTGLSSTTPIASISAKDNGGNKNGLVLNASLGSIQSLQNQTLTIGGNSTGDISFQPGDEATPGTSLYLASNGNVGIGTTTPAYPLDIESNATSTGNDAVLNIGGNLTFTSGQQYGIFSKPIAAAGGASTAVYTGGVFDPYATDASHLTSAELEGVVGTNQYNGTGTLGYEVGGYFQNQLTAAGIVTNSIGAYIDNPNKTSGTITNNVGIEIIQQTQATNNTNALIGTSTIPSGNYSIYNASTYNNYFAGSLGIGTNSIGNGELTINQPNSSGNIFSASASGNTQFVITNSGNVGIGTITPLATLDVRGNTATTPAASVSATSTYAAMEVNNNGTGDLFTASKSGATKFVVQNNGNIGIAANQVIDTLTNGTLGIGTANATSLILGRSGQSLDLPNYGGANNSILFANNSVNGIVTAVAATSANNQCLLSNSTGTPSWGACDLGTTSWVQANGTIYPGNSTEDLLVGGTSTASAKFAFIGSAGTATPVASISAQTASGIGLVMSPGQIQSLNNATLTIGGNTTGNILLEPLSGTAGQVQFFNANNFITSGGALTLASSGNALNLTGGGANIDFTGAGVGQIITAANQNLALMPGGTGDVGVNVTSGLLATLDVRGNIATTPAASVSATSTYAAMEVNNNGSGDIFTASESGATKFTIKNSGVVVIGNTTNGIQFDPSGAATCNGQSFYAVFCGTAQPTGKIVLSPEYPGAALTASNSANTNGFMTSDASPSAQDSQSFRTYYQWTSTQTSLNDYTVAVRVTLPANFAGWAASNAVTIDVNTQLTTSPDNALDVIMYNHNFSDSTPVLYDQNETSSSQNTWKTIGYSPTQLTNWATAGQTATIFLRLHAMNSNFVQVGDIVLNYKQAY